VVADKKLLLVAICVLSQWTLEQMTQQLPPERGRVRQVPGAAGPHWHHRAAPTQPLPAQAGQSLSLAAARPGDGLFPRPRPAGLLRGRVRWPRRRPAAGARLHQPRAGTLVSGTHAARGAGLCTATPGRPKLAEADRTGYTLLLAMRSWEFEAFARQPIYLDATANMDEVRLTRLDNSRAMLRVIFSAAAGMIPHQRIDCVVAQQKSANRRVSVGSGRPSVAVNQTHFSNKLPWPKSRQAR
jgi:hypothetical protein